MPIYAEKNMRYAHSTEICEKCGNMRNMRHTHRSSIRIKLTRLNCATLRMMNYFRFDCRTMYCTHYYHHHPPPHNAITSDTVCTPYSCLHIQNNYPILISSHTY